MTIDVCNYSKLDYFNCNDINIKFFLRIKYFDGCYKVKTNAIFLTYPQVSLTSTSIEIIYLRIILHDNLPLIHEYEIRRSKCTAMKIDDEIIIQDENNMFSISEKCINQIIEHFNTLSKNNCSLTNLRKIVLSKKLASVIYFTEENSLFNSWYEVECL